MSRHNYKFVEEHKDELLRFRWSEDKKGLKTTEIAIVPVINYIRKAIESHFTDDLYNRIIKMKNNKIYNMELFSYAKKLLIDIDNSIISIGLIKYLSPELHISDNQQLLIENYDINQKTPYKELLLKK